MGFSEEWKLKLNRYSMINFEFFDKAHSTLMLNNEAESIKAYVRSVNSILNSPSGVNLSIIMSEIAYLDKCNNLNSSLKESIKLYLNISMFLIADSIHRNQYQTYLENHKIRKEPFKSPVIIVAGGSSRMDETKASEYQVFIHNLFKRFRGTIISGGTNTGIPGLLGVVKGEMEKRQPLDFELVAYLPANLPVNTIKSTAYDHFYETDSDYFSVLDVLSYWCDLVCSGINPSDVILVGIEGGDIAAMEYRIALSLGAKVGLITGSGRAVTELRNDEFWKNHPNLLEIPNDPRTILALINRQLEKIAGT